jgi:hypothetical protein
MDELRDPVWDAFSRSVEHESAHTMAHQNNLAKTVGGQVVDRGRDAIDIAAEHRARHG